MKLYCKTWHILIIFFFWEAHRLHWAFCSHVSFVNLFISHKQYFFFPFLSFLLSFDKKVMQTCADIMGLGLWESIQGPLVRHQAQLPIFFGGIGLLFMEDCAPSIFLRNWTLVVSYLCFMFCIFDRPIFE